MSKEFILYEEALALKELGFNEPCMGWFDNENTFMTGGYDFRALDEGYKGSSSVLAPLYQQAFRWFREKYNLHCFVQYHSKPEYSIIVYNDLRVEYKSTDELTMYNTYEEAELACLRKLIEIVNQNKDE